MLSRTLCTLLVLTALAGCTDTTERSPGDAANATSDVAAPNSANAPLSHAHNYYGGLTELTLMDATVALTVAHNHMFDEPPREQHTHGCEETLASSSQGGSVKFSLPAGSIVPPGTARLDVTASWSAPAITGVRLLYRPPSHDHGPSDDQHLQHNDFMDAGDLQNGAPLAIDVEPTMTDQGHQFHSNWAFFLCASGGDSVQLAQGDIKFLVAAVRAGEIPVDPPHPDRWQGNTTLRLGSRDWSGRAATVANQGDAWFQIPLDDGAIVPWGTNHIRVNVTSSSSGPLDAVHPHDVTLYYHDASSVEWVYDRVEGEGSVDDRIFIIPIDRGEAEDFDALDSPYAAKTHWDFWVRISSATGAGVPTAGYWTTPHVFEGSLRATVTAVGTPQDG